MLRILTVGHLITMACVEWTWEGLLAKCKKHQTYGPDIAIPTASQ